MRKRKGKPCHFGQFFDGNIVNDHGWKKMANGRIYLGGRWRREVSGGWHVEISLESSSRSLSFFPFSLIFAIVFPTHLPPRLGSFFCALQTRTHARTHVHTPARRDRHKHLLRDHKISGVARKLSFILVVHRPEDRIKDLRHCERRQKQRIPAG